MLLTAIPYARPRIHSRGSCWQLLPHASAGSSFGKPSPHPSEPNPRCEIRAVAEDHRLDFPGKRVCKGGRGKRCRGQHTHPAAASIHSPARYRSVGADGACVGAKHNTDVERMRSARALLGWGVGEKGARLKCFNIHHTSFPPLATPLARKVKRMAGPARATLPGPLRAEGAASCRGERGQRHPPHDGASRRFSHHRGVRPSKVSPPRPIFRMLSHRVAHAFFGPEHPPLELQTIKSARSVQVQASNDAMRWAGASAAVPGQEGGPGGARCRDHGAPRGGLRGVWGGRLGHPEQTQRGP